MSNTIRELNFTECCLIKGGSRGQMGRRNNYSGWSRSSCNTLGHINSFTGSLSFVSWMVPGGQAVSAFSGGISFMGTVVWYNKCVSRG